MHRDRRLFKKSEMEVLGGRDFILGQSVGDAATR
jgi:hypothetical protein